MPTTSHFVSINHNDAAAHDISCHFYIHHGGTMFSHTLLVSRHDNTERGTQGHKQAAER